MAAFFYFSRKKINSYFYRIADFFAQNRRFFLQESQIFCIFAAESCKDMNDRD